MATAGMAGTWRSTLLAAATTSLVRISRRAARRPTRSASARSLRRRWKPRPARSTQMAPDLPRSGRRGRMVAGGPARTIWVRPFPCLTKSCGMWDVGRGTRARCDAGTEPSFIAMLTVRHTHPYNSSAGIHFFMHNNSWVEKNLATNPIALL